MQKKKGSGNRESRFRLRRKFELRREDGSRGGREKGNPGLFASLSHKKTGGGLRKGTRSE